MNDHTPRRLKGSLLERAAQGFHYAPAPIDDAPVAPVAKPAPKRVEAPVVAPEMQVQPAPVVVPQPAPQAEHFPGEGRGPASASQTESLGPGLRRGEAQEEAAPQIAVARPTGRRMAPLDRAVLEKGGMLMPGAAIGPLAEEFRMVKRQLLLTARAVAAKDTAKAADRARMILVCSAQPSEGKTFCAINLALSMATEKDVEVLLVDADFPKPDVLPRMGLPGGPGLLDVLAGSVANVEDCIIDTDIPQLSVLPAGARSNSDTELLASDRARAVIDGLAEANPRRIVIFDSPPALAASPASVLALHVGQVMLVVRADQTSESDLRAAVNTLDACEHIQLVLNSVSFQPGGRRFGSYYEYGEESR
ncbi:AAA family ATPase [Sphingomonas sp. R-74633]|uniref:AAA family ATPase n=1 Tax=Sphingomonas sp. R-74633 TaxID=2751188 RepID=UPI0015D3FA4F|nr:AAA family ATPase [Sphingomonas sp. R-74633]NYT39483.1 AAA family ATPase [Sphingomonas sp. R-74633]